MSKSSQPETKRASDEPGDIISAEKLCAITGLTDRRHRQLAKDGFFPPPIKGQYQMSATLRGIFKSYRERGEYLKNNKEQIDEEKHRKLKLANDEQEGLLTPTEKLIAAAAPALVAVRDITYQKLQNEMPIATAGMDVPQSRIYGGRLADEIMLKWKAVFKAWEI